jgi:predicted secreted Zn-dependent protease
MDEQNTQVSPEELVNFGWRRVVYMFPLFVALCLNDGRGAYQPEVCVPRVSYQSYDIQGTTMEEWRSAMVKKGPRDSRGKARFARADWSVLWKWRLDVAEKIDPESVEIECSAEILLPRLVPTEGLSLAASKEWWLFLERIRTHELNHVRHAVEVSPRIKQIIKGQQQYLTAEQGNSIGFTVLREIRTLDRVYDISTHHGSTEGIWGNS